MPKGTNPADIKRQDTYLLWPVYGREGVRAYMKVPLWFEEKYIGNRFSMHTAGYAVTRMSYRLTYAHHLVITSESGRVIDHINRDKLDNRPENLRLVTHSDNLKNNGKDNVGYDKRRKNWRAWAKIDGRFVHLGSYPTREEAVVGRKERLSRLFA